MTSRSWVALGTCALSLLAGARDMAHAAQASQPAQASPPAQASRPASGAEAAPQAAPPAPAQTGAQAAPSTRPQFEPLRALAPDHVSLSDRFLAPRAELGRAVVWPAVWAQCERAGRMRAFEIAGGAPGEHTGPVDGDADVYQLIRAASVSLAHVRDAALEARIDAVIETIAKAQRPDGYLDTWFQVREPERRWSDPVRGRELWCAGELFSAAASYAQATGRERLLDVATRLADHIGSEFGPEKRRDPDAFPGIERGLVTLARFTGQQRYAELARFFLDQRGRRGSRTPLGADALDDVPVRELKEASGNAVRALELYRGALAVSQFFQDDSWLPAQFSAWRDLATRHLYVTGGVGNGSGDGSFGAPYELPNDGACCETCASIALAEWCRELFLATGKTTFVELYENALYNAIPASLALDGRSCFDTNPLASRGEHTRSLMPERRCCALALARFLPTLPEYVYATRPGALHVALYAQGNVDFDVGGTHVRVTQVTDLPWKGHVEIGVEPDRPTRFELWLRIPIWAENHDIAPPPIKAGEPVEPALPRDVRTSGDWWKVLTREWKRGDRIHINFGLDPQRRESDPKVLANAGCVALQSGPLVYGFEAADNGGRAQTLVLKPEHVDLTSSWRAELLGGTNVLVAKAERRRASDNPFVAPTEPATIVAIPYALWGNRGTGEFRVWVPTDPLLANAPDEGVRFALSATRMLRASNGVRGDDLAALDDGVFGARSNDTSVARATFWPGVGARDGEPADVAAPPATEWFEAAYRAPRELSGCTVQWFDDGGRCRVPRRWRLVARTADGWRDVELRSGAYGTDADVRHTVAFAPLSTTALRLAVELQPGCTAGALEWRVAESDAKPAPVPK